MIFTILSIIIALYALKDYKKSIIIFTIYQIIWYPTVFIRFSGFRIGTNAIIPLWYFILYLYNNRKHLNKDDLFKFPFFLPFLLIICSSFLSCITAASGFQIEFARFLTRLFSLYIYIWLLWKCIDFKKDFKFIFRLITYTILISCIYGLIEYFTKTNFVLDYKVFLSNNSITLYNASGIRGYRLTSLFEHPIGASMTFGIYCTFYLSLLFKGSNLIKNDRISAITAILCVPCIILSKMRTGIIFWIISLAIVVMTNHIKKDVIKKYIKPLILVSLVVLILIITNLNLFKNLISSNTSKEVGGSSLQMRMTQLNAIMHIVSESPVFGLGETFRGYIVRTEYTDLALGYEGLIFEKMIMYGYFGLLVYIFYIFFSLYIIPKKHKTKDLYFLFIPYWIAYLVSSIPSFRTTLLYIFCLYYLKINCERNKIE